MDKKIKLLVKGPLTTCSGYSERSRDLFKALCEDERFEVDAMPISWGNASQWYGNIDLKEKIVECAKRSYEKINANSEEETKNRLLESYDASIQIFTAVEFRKLTKINIGITAGIESDCVLPSWNEHANMMDLVIVPSNHSKIAFENQKEVELKTSIEICPEGVNIEKFEDIKIEELDDDLKFSTKYNFLAAGQWIFGDIGEDRKQMGFLVKLFYEVFKERSDVGLIIKTFKYKNTILDYRIIEKQIKEIKASVKATIYPPIYLVHGYLPLEKMIRLYKHPRIIAFVSPTSGEGYGRHFIEIAACEKPIICVYWSGHTDFLDENLIIKIPYELKQIPEIYAAAMPAFFNPTSKWALPNFQKTGEILYQTVNDFKNNNYQKYLDNAKKLKTNIIGKLDHKKVLNNFCDLVYKTICEKSNLTEGL